MEYESAFLTGPTLMTSPLSRRELQAIRDRVDLCIPGPWIHRGDGIMETSDHQLLGVTCSGGPNCSAEGLLPRADHAEFLTAARTDVPRLLSELDRLQAEVESLRNLRGSEPRRAEIVFPAEVSFISTSNDGLIVDGESIPSQPAVVTDVGQNLWRAG